MAELAITLSEELWALFSTEDAGVDENKEAVIAAIGALDELKDSKDSADSRRQYDHLRELYKYSLAVRSRPTILAGKKKSAASEHGLGLSVLLKYCEPSKAVNVQAMAVGVLANISLTQKFGEMLIRGGVLDYITSGVERSKNEALLADIARLYLNLASTEWARIELVTRNQVPKIIRLTQIRSPEIQANALGSLGNISMLERMAPKLVEAGVDATCFELLKSPDSNAQEEALRCLGNIIRQDRFRNRVIDAGIVDDVAQLLQHRKQQVVRNAAACTSNLCATKRDDLLYSIAKSVTPSLLLVFDQNDTEVTQHVAFCLRQLSMSKSARATLVSCGAIPILCKRLFAADAPTRNNSLFALSEIAREYKVSGRDMAQADMPLHIEQYLKQAKQLSAADAQIEHGLIVIMACTYDFNMRNQILVTSIPDLVAGYARAKNMPRVAVIAVDILRRLVLEETGTDPGENAKVNDLMKAIRMKGKQIKAMTPGAAVSVSRKELEKRSQANAVKGRGKAQEEDQRMRRAKVKSAILIQSWYRGWNTRRNVLSKELDAEVRRDVKEILKVDPELDEARVFNFLKSQKLKIPPTERKRMSEKHQAALDVQRLFRGYRARQERIRRSKKYNKVVDAAPLPQSTHMRVERIKEGIGRFNREYLAAVDDQLKALKEDTKYYKVRNEIRKQREEQERAEAESKADFLKRTTEEEREARRHAEDMEYISQIRRAAGAESMEEGKSESPKGASEEKAENYELNDSRVKMPENLDLKVAPRRDPIKSAPGSAYGTGGVAIRYDENIPGPLSMQDLCDNARIYGMNLTTTTSTDGRKLSYVSVPSEGLDISVLGVPAHTHLRLKFRLFSLGKWLGSAATASGELPHEVEVKVNGTLVASGSMSTIRGVGQSFNTKSLISLTNSTITNPAGWSASLSLPDGFAYDVETTIPHTSHHLKIEIDAPDKWALPFDFGRHILGVGGVLSMDFLVNHPSTPLLTTSVGELHLSPSNAACQIDRYILFSKDYARSKMRHEEAASMFNDQSQPARQSYVVPNVVPNASRPETPQAVGGLFSGNKNVFISDSPSHSQSFLFEDRSVSPERSEGFLMKGWVNPSKMGPGENGKPSRPSSAKGSRPSSAKGSRPSSAKLRILHAELSGRAGAFVYESREDESMDTEMKHPGQMNPVRIESPPPDKKVETPSRPTSARSRPHADLHMMMKEHVKEQRKAEEEKLRRAAELRQKQEMLQIAEDNIRRAEAEYRAVAPAQSYGVRDLRMANNEPVNVEPSIGTRLVYSVNRPSSVASTRVTQSSRPPSRASRPTSAASMRAVSPGLSFGSECFVDDGYYEDPVPQREEPKIKFNFEGVNPEARDMDLEMPKPGIGGSEQKERVSKKTKDPNWREKFGFKDPNKSGPITTETGRMEYSVRNMWKPGEKKASSGMNPSKYAPVGRDMTLKAGESYPKSGPGEAEYMADRISKYIPTGSLDAPSKKDGDKFGDRDQYGRLRYQPHLEQGSSPLSIYQTSARVINVQNVRPHSAASSRSNVASRPRPVFSPPTRMPGAASQVEKKGEFNSVARASGPRASTKPDEKEGAHSLLADLRILDKQEYGAEIEDTVNTLKNKVGFIDLDDKKYIRFNEHTTVRKVEPQEVFTISSLGDHHEQQFRWNRSDLSLKSVLKEKGVKPKGRRTSFTTPAPPEVPKVTSNTPLSARIADMSDESSPSGRKRPRTPPRRQNSRPTTPENRGIPSPPKSRATSSMSMGSRKEYRPPSPRHTQSRENTSPRSKPRSMTGEESLSHDPLQRRSSGLKPKLLPGERRVRPKSPKRVKSRNSSPNSSRPSSAGSRRPNSAGKRPASVASSQAKSTSSKPATIFGEEKKSNEWWKYM